MTVTLERACPSAAAARRLAASVSADNPPYVEVTVEGAVLSVRLTASSAASARASLDDLVACLAAAERADPEL